MAKLIQQVTKGDPDTLLVTDRANELIDALNALLNMQVQPAELGSFVVGDTGNAILTLTAQTGGTPTPTDTDYPFRLKLVSNGVVRVVYGTINDIVPYGMYPGDNPSFTISVSGLGYIYLQFGYDDNTGVISSVQILAGETIPASTAYVVTKQIGSYENSGQALANSVTTSLWFERCGYLDLFGTA